MVAVLVAVVNENYPGAKSIMRTLSPKDRSIVIFYAQEMTGVAGAVQSEDERY